MQFIHWFYWGDAIVWKVDSLKLSGAKERQRLNVIYFVMGEFESFEFAVDWTWDGMDNVIALRSFAYDDDSAFAFLHFRKQSFPTFGICANKVPLLFAEFFSFILGYCLMALQVTKLSSELSVTDRGHWIIIFLSL